jgi:hypothetical protein
MSQEQNELKRKLYHAILCTPLDQLTDRDVQLGYVLMQDPYIQELLSRKEINSERKCGYVWEDKEGQVWLCDDPARIYSNRCEVHWSEGDKPTFTFDTIAPQYKVKLWNKGDNAST